MRRQRLLGLVVVSCVGALLTGTVLSSAPAANPHLAPAETESRSREALHGDEAPAAITAGQLQASGPIIIDHTCTDLSQVPD